jgi:phthalate 4,5-cis-dihydrodiol dehydrogenase
MNDSPLRIGVIGVGVGARQLLPALTHHPSARLAAAADIRPAALDQLRAEFGIQTFASAEALCNSDTVDAVWVASPNHLHAEHAITASERGKHVIVSKPMAVTLDEAQRMTDAAARHGTLLLAGHTQSMAPSIRRMADMVRVGELGRLGMIHTWHFTDWMYRPRLPDELDTARGGGPVFRQASHQVDIVRTIGGRRLRSVRAATLQLDASRPVPGAYTVFMNSTTAYRRPSCTPVTVTSICPPIFEAPRALHQSSKVRTKQRARKRCATALHKMATAAARGPTHSAFSA